MNINSAKTPTGWDWAAAAVLAGLAAAWIVAGSTTGKGITVVPLPYCLAAAGCYLLILPRIAPHRHAFLAWWAGAFGTPVVHGGAVLLLGIDLSGAGPIVSIVMMTGLALMPLAAVAWVNWHSATPQPTNGTTASSRYPG